MSTTSSHQEILILDFGSQYTHLIARRVRELKVFSRIVPPDIRADQARNAAGIILSGGPQSVVDERIAFDPALLHLGIPVLGLCYGHQLMAYTLGGEVRPGTTSEYGIATVRVNPGGIFTSLGSQEQVWMSHGDSVTKVPSGFTVTGTTSDCPVAAMADERRRLYGLQFHPEVTHTVHGMTILSNFVLSVCGARQDWTQEAMLEEITAQIVRDAGSRNVFLLVSGGVDSTVCFALLEKALGKDRVYGLHVDSGLMRYRESQGVAHALAAAGFSNLHVVDAAEHFFSALEGVTDPEQKRVLIGSTFLRVKERAMAKLKLDPDQWVLAQGTIYPDTIETGRTAHADVIKTHHNRIPELQQLAREGRVIEPIKDLYKDEVRMVGEMLGLPKELVWRHPFPGPGLGIRVLCADGSRPAQDIQQVTEMQDVVMDLLHSSTVSAHILPLKSVGVQGDQRTYRHAAIITGTDDISAVGKISPQLTNSLSFINRVLVCVGGDADMIVSAQTHRAHVTRERVALLQEIDHEIHRIVTKAGLGQRVWQFPVVLIPFGIHGKESIILRPIWSQEAMTAHFFEFPHEVVQKMAEVCTSHTEVSFVLYDVTNKPPATIEWE